MRLPGKVALISGASRGIAVAVPRRRCGEPRELAALALFLASEESAYISGSLISIDGGKATGRYAPGM